jgi:ERCC4-related helicase
MVSINYVKFLANNILFKLDESETAALKSYLIKLDKENVFDLKSQENILLIIDRLVEEKTFELNRESDQLLAFFNSINKIDCSIVLDSFYGKNEEPETIQKITNDLNNNFKVCDFVHVVKINGLDVELFFKPFNFQLKLAQNSIDHLNNIICIRTGSGKTFIASILCKYWYTKYKKENRLDKFKVAFIVPTKNLADQQAKAFEKAFDPQDLQEINEKCNETKIKMYFDTKKIIFLTHQKLKNTLDKNLLKIIDFSILIFDECHHTDNDHPYKKLMLDYYDQKRFVKTPSLIVGLTASQGIGKESSAISHLINLCANMDSKVVSSLFEEEDLDELRHSIPTPLEDEIICVENSSHFNKLNHIVQSISNTIYQNSKLTGSTYYNVKIGSPEYIEFLHNTKLLVEKSHNLVQIVSIKYLIELNLFYIRKEDFPLDYCLNMLKSFYKETMLILNPNETEIFCRNLIKSTLDFIDKDLNNFSKNYKLEKLVELINNCHKDNSRGLVLVRTRHHTKALCEFLNKHTIMSKVSFFFKRKV